MKNRTIEADKLPTANSLPTTNSKALVESAIALAKKQSTVWIEGGERNYYSPQKDTKAKQK